MMLSAVATVFLLLGIALIFAMTGSVSLYLMLPPLLKGAAPESN